MVELPNEDLARIGHADRSDDLVPLPDQAGLFFAVATGRHVVEPSLVGVDKIEKGSASSPAAAD